MKAAVGILILFAMLLMSTLSVAEVYKNREFGITLKLPRQLPTCSGAQDTHDHGITIFLDTNETGGCGENGKRRLISVFSFYNVVDETRTLRDYLQWECTRVLKGKCTYISRNLKIGKLRSLSARLVHQDGWVDVIVAAQGERASNQHLDDTTAIVNYSVILHTTVSYLEQDMVTLRSILSKLEISPPL